MGSSHSKEDQEYQSSAKNFTKQELMLLEQKYENFKLQNTCSNAWFEFLQKSLHQNSSNYKDFVIKSFNLLSNFHELLKERISSHETLKDHEFLNIYLETIAFSNNDKVKNYHLATDEAFTIKTLLFENLTNLFYSRLLELSLLERSASFLELPSLQGVGNHISNISFPSFVFLFQSLKNLSLEYDKSISLLYSSSIHGKSWLFVISLLPLISQQQFAFNVKKRGSILISIEDEDGYKFGAFVKEDLSYKPNFYGSNDNFLISFSPTFDIYRSSGYNSNFQYFNHGTQSLPNGLGFGGQLDYFGLWIDSDFGKGHSKANPSSTTYLSPRLSAKESFVIKNIEVWLVKKTDDDNDDDLKQSAMVANPETMAFLEMANRKTYHVYEEKKEEE